MNSSSSPKTNAAIVNDAAITTSALPTDEQSSQCADKKSVNFESKSTIYYVPTLDELTEDDFNRMFLSQQDRTRIEQDIIQSISALKRIEDQTSTGDEATDQCFRGLETMTSSTHIDQAKTGRERVIDSVLDEQERQWNEHNDVVDFQCLAEASTRHSSRAIEGALSRAADDALYVERMQSQSSA